MALSYNRMWKLLVDKKMSKADLRKAADIAPNTMTKLRRDEAVNIAILGRIGSALFPESILCLGAGLNQIKKWGFQFGDISTFFDDPRDNQMIKWGVSLYNGE